MQNVSTQSFEIIHSVIYGFHMPLFFFASGFYIHKWTQRNLLIAIKEKMFRLMVPYFVWVMIVSVIKWLTVFWQNNPISLGNVLLSPIVPFEEYWFIYLMFFIQIIYYFFCRLKKRWLFDVLSVFAFAISPFVPGVWIFELLCQYSIFFALGSILEVEKLSTMIAKKKVPIVIGFIIVNCTLVNSSEFNNSIVNRYFFFVTSISGIAFFLLLSIYLNDKVKIIQFCGQKSMEIYCIHPSISGITRIVIMKIIGVKFPWSRTVLDTLITVVLCLLLFRLWPSNGILYKTLFGGWKVKQS